MQILSIMKYPTILFLVHFPQLILSQSMGEYGQPSECGKNYEVNYGESFIFTDKPSGTTNRGNKLSSPSKPRSNQRHHHDIHDEVYPKEQIDYSKEDSFQSRVESIPSYETLDRDYRLNPHHEFLDGRKNVVHNQIDAQSENHFPLINSYENGDGPSFSIPLLYNHYFKKDDPAHSDRNEEKKNDISKKPMDLFKVIKKHSERIRRNADPTSRHVTKSCTWTYSIGSDCKSLVTHMVSGDRNIMDCNEQFLSFSSGREQSKFCNTGDSKKTQVHGKHLSISNFKRSGSFGKSFKGFVTCK